MRVPLSWLRDYVEVELEPDRLAERLTLLGMEVKSVEHWGADWRSVVVGELVEVRPHPNADRLSLTRVTVGDQTLDIVCGATNIAAGQRVPVALPGAVLPGGRAIERTEKMGVVSNGMLCSGDELGLTSDAEGILILPAETPVGAGLTDLYGDVVLDVDVKPNRGDALSLVGLAREVGAATGAPLRFPDCAVDERGDPIDGLLEVEVEDAVLCPRFVGRHVSGVTVGPSPDLVQMRLMAAGMRPISNVVDASNFVMLELGKPIHTFDAAAVTDGRIIVRVARPGERLETLDHVERLLSGDTLLIADPAGPLAIAGVMGGASSEVSDATKEVVIESAIFDPVSIRRTAFRYALRSEASLRFEKGQEHRLARLGADRTARLILDWAGGQVAVGHVDTAPEEPAHSRIAFRPARVDRLLGASLSADEQRTLLGRVGIETEAAAGGTVVPVAMDPEPLTVIAGEGEALLAIVPTWRRDIAVEADLAEEVARVRGYELVPSLTPDTPMPSYLPDPLATRHQVRETLAGAGLTEVVTHALVAPAADDRFGPLDDGPVPAGETEARGGRITVANPLSRDHSILRRSLLGSLLDVVGTNVRHGRNDVAVFEIGKGYGRDDEGIHEWWRLGLALAGEARPAFWADEARAFDLDDAKGLLELVGRTLGADRAAYAPLRDAPDLHPGRSARILLGDPAAPVLVGRVGELHPDMIQELGLRTDRVMVGEVAVRGLTEGAPRPVVAVPPPRYPAVERDLAIVVPEPTPAGDVMETVGAAAGPLLAGQRLFDIYRGSPLAVGDKSLAVRLEFRAADRTLTEDEIEAVVAVILGSIGQRGWSIRT
jgi:phenylalanyl-tRNA synthetase beta chain